MNTASAPIIPPTPAPSKINSLIQSLRLATNENSDAIKGLIDDLRPIVVDGPLPEIPAYNTLELCPLGVELAFILDVVNHQRATIDLLRGQIQV